MSRSMAAAKKAGSALEHATARFFAWVLRDDRIEPRRQAGAKDRGDVGGLRIHGQRVVIECKSPGPGRPVDLGTWIREAETERGNDDAAIGIIIHKRPGRSLNTLRGIGQQYVTMTLDDFVWVVTGSRPPYDELVVLDDVE